MQKLPRLGLIGLGRWGGVYLRTLESLRDQCKLTHVATSRPATTAELPQGVKVTPRWQELVQGECDAVLIATPPHTHAEMVEACLENHKPCLVEKPLCLDVPTAKGLHQRIQSSEHLVLVNHILLFHPAYQALKKALSQSGETIRLILSEGGALGPFRSDTDALWDWCPHDLSVCLDLLQKQPLRMAALGGPPDPKGSPEAVSIRLDFPDGASAWIHAGRLQGQKRRGLSVFTDSHLYLFNDMALPKLTVSAVDFKKRYSGGIPDSLEMRPIEPLSTQSPLASVLTYFLEGLAGGDRRYFGLDLALEITRLLEECDHLLHLASPPEILREPR